eukprot:CAMPEP_0172451236 /NCGR_PEP_ID=MMETSP1065-20121228/9350_1 /TAXON_ID=265537 /ORGANISM="Amphiprora paludosa, Strain CCMP125" /LENGTH=406 /DNA_ID=CAMNT_0013203165 /DNA_START=126 /DNA_END=1346 /DNA_ORIENTATION=-
MNNDNDNNRPGLTPSKHHHGMVLAADMGDLDLIRLLLDDRIRPQDFDIDLALQESDKGLKGFTILSAACWKEHPAVALYLLHSCGASASAEGGTMRSNALMAACATQQLSLVRVLIRAGANMMQSTEDGSTAGETQFDLTFCSTPLGYMFFIGNLDVVKVLLEEIKGLPSDHAQEEAMKGVAQLILFAIKKNNLPSLRTLIESSAMDPNMIIIDSNPQLSGTPLWLAVLHDRWEMVQYLLQEHNVEVDKVSSHDIPTPFLLLCFNRKDIRSPYSGPMRCAIQGLLQHGANPNPPCHEDFVMTPLLAAIRANDLPVVQILKEAGADLMNPGLLPYPPFHFACVLGQVQIVEYFMTLCHEGIDFRQPIHIQGNQATPFSIACNRDDLNVIYCLIRNGWASNTNMPMTL